MKSFIIGMAKCMDLGGTLTNQKTIEEVIAEDWKALGSDMFKAIGDYEKHKKPIYGGNAVQRPNTASNNIRAI